jgi:hypothetical protein
MYRFLKSFSTILILVVFAGLFWQPYALGAEDEKIEQDEVLYEDILTDFEDQMTEEQMETGDVALANGDAESQERFMRVSGWLQQRAVYNYDYPDPQPGETDHRGLSSLRAEFAPAVAFRFSNGWKARFSGRLRYEPIFALKGRDDFTPAYLDDSETEAELWDAFIEGSPLQGLSIKVGRQIVVWGTSESLRVTDVLNPLDYREPGMTDIENMRLPLAMTRLDYTWRQLTLSGIAIHEFRPSKIPAFGSDYYISDEPLPPDYEPDDAIENTEYAFSLTAQLTGWDLSLYFADIFADEPYLIMASGPLVARLPFESPVLLPPVFENWYSRLTMYGAALTVARRNWLLKSEAAYFQGNRYFSALNAEKDRLNALVGVEYSGFKDTSVSLEYAVQRIFDYDENMALFPQIVEEHENQAALRILRDFRRDTLHVLATVVLMNDHGDDGWLARIQAEYDWTDALSLTLGGIVYGAAADGKYAAFKDNDRVFALVRYSF